MVLALSSVLTTVFSSRNGPTASSPLVSPVLVFMVATGLSILVSKDMDRSVRLSMPLLPAALLFLLIAEHFRSAQHTRLLYVTFSMVGLGLASAVLWTAWGNSWAVPDSWRSWVPDVGSPMLVVPNDGTFLAVVAPLSY
jgi:predicted permease